MRFLEVLLLLRSFFSLHCIILTLLDSHITQQLSWCLGVLPAQFIPIIIVLIGPKEWGPANFSMDYIQNWAYSTIIYIVLLKSMVFLICDCSVFNNRTKNSFWTSLEIPNMCHLNRWRTIVCIVNNVIFVPNGNDILYSGTCPSIAWQDN